MSWVLSSPVLQESWTQGGLYGRTHIDTTVEPNPSHPGSDPCSPPLTCKVSESGNPDSTLAHRLLGGVR